MGTHLYDNPGPHQTVTRTSIGGTVAIPATTDVRLWDGADHVQLTYTDLDALDETVRLFEEARASHIAALLEGRNEIVKADQLERDDLALVDNELVIVHTLTLTERHVTILFARRYAGAFDLTADRSIRVLRSLPVKRLLPTADLKAVG